MAATKDYLVQFERIGRTHDVSTQVTAKDADDLAEQVWRFCGRHLGSRGYVVGLDLDEGKGSIEGGRFGRFTFAEVTP